MDLRLDFAVGVSAGHRLGWVRILIETIMLRILPWLPESYKVTAWVEFHQRGIIPASEPQL